VLKAYKEQQVFKALKVLLVFKVLKEQQEHKAFKVL
jgi:hypothetical protein